MCLIGSYDYVAFKVVVTVASFGSIYFQTTKMLFWFNLILDL